MDRRQACRVVCSLGVAALVGTGGCVEDSKAAEITIVEGYVERETDMFEVELTVEQTGAGGEYHIAVQVHDGAGTIFSFDRIQGETPADADTWTEIESTKAPDRASEIGEWEDYEATATIIDVDEGDKTEEVPLKTG